MIENIVLDRWGERTWSHIRFEYEDLTRGILLTEGVKGLACDLIIKLSGSTQKHRRK